MNSHMPPSDIAKRDGYQTAQFAGFHLLLFVLAPFVVLCMSGGQDNIGPVVIGHALTLITFAVWRPQTLRCFYTDNDPMSPLLPHCRNTLLGEPICRWVIETIVRPLAEYALFFADVLLGIVAVIVFPLIDPSRYQRIERAWSSPPHTLLLQHVHTLRGPPTAYCA